MLAVEGIPVLAETLMGLVVGVAMQAKQAEQVRRFCSSLVKVCSGQGTGI